MGVMSESVHKCRNKHDVDIVNTMVSKYKYTDYGWVMVFNATFNTISAISWRPVLVVEEAGVPGENHRPWASN